MEFHDIPIIARVLHYQKSMIKNVFCFIFQNSEKIFKSAILQISRWRITISIIENADSDKMNSSLRGVQNKRNANLGVILESLIFSEIQNRENSGIFSNLRNFTISP